MLEVTPMPPSPPPQMDRSRSRSADYNIATGPFHFCLDKAAVLNDFPHSAFVLLLDQTPSIWHNKVYIFFSSFFPRPPQPNHVYHCPFQMQKPLKQLREPSQPPAIYNIYSKWIQNWQQKWVWLQSIICYKASKSNSKGDGGGDSSVVRAPDSWLKGRGFESLLERRENFLLQGPLSVLTLISVSVPPPCYHSST